MFKGQARPKHLRHLFHLLVSLSVLGALLLMNIPIARADDVGGPIDTDTTWTLAGSPYIVVSPVLVMEGVTLTIEPGVTVKFNSHKAIQVDGELIAIGTVENPITFTSNVGTNPGDWDYIVFADTSVDAVYDVDGNYVSGSILKYVIIEYAGGASLEENNGALRLDAAGPFITYTTVQNSATSGIIGFHNPVTIKMTHNSVMNNAGTGINVTGTTYLEITDNTIVGNVNSAYSLGGGIRAETITGIISRNVIRGNSHVWSGSGIDFTGSATISDNVITENAIANCYPCWDRHALVSGGGGDVVIMRNNLIAYNFTGGISNRSTSPTVIDNIIIHNEGMAMEVWGVISTVSHNVISDNMNGMSDIGAFFQRGGPTNLSYNSIVRNTAQNNAALVYGGSDEGSAINANTIVDNVNQAAPGDLRTVSIDGHPTFNDNNIYNNTGYALYSLSLQGSGNINAENNWWGTSSSPAIQALIYDWFDDPALTIVDFNPYRTDFNLDAPVSPPTGLDVTSGLTSLSLGWDANPESDVIGYKIYYDIDDRYPYTGTGADQGDSPIDVGNTLNYTLTGLPDGVYHLTVTAYDSDADGAHDQTDGNESWLSVDETGMLGEPLQAEFSATPTSGYVPLLISFTNESGGAYTSCEWDFGDGGTSSVCLNPTHSYDTEGTFTVSLTIYGPGANDILIKPDYITVNYPIYLSLIQR